MFKYTTQSPCRCGHDGTGTHRCHAGRPDPHGTGEDGSRWCQEPALDRLTFQIASLSGAMPKGGGIATHYCRHHLKPEQA